MTETAKGDVEYQIHFVATLAYSSPDAFTENLRTSYKKGVVLAVGMDPDKEYERVVLTVSGGNRRLLQGTIDVSTTVRLDNATQVASAMASVNLISLGAALAHFDSSMQLTAMSAIDLSFPLSSAVVATPTPTTASAISVELLIGLIAGVLVVCCLVCILLCVMSRRDYERVPDSEEC